MGAIANDEMITAKDGQQHSWKSIKLLIATLIVSTLGDGFCGVMMAVALPNISETYHVSIATANWVTVGYAIVAATAVMTAATVLARIGLKKLFFWSRVLLIVSSLIGLFSLNFPMMLTSRLIQAVGSGLMFPTINTVIIRVVPAKISGRVVSLNSAIIGLGIAVAPLLSGVFLTYVSLTSMYVVPLAVSSVTDDISASSIFSSEPMATIMPSGEAVEWSLLVSIQNNFLLLYIIIFKGMPTGAFQMHSNQTFQRYVKQRKYGCLHSHTDTGGCVHLFF